MGRPKSLAGLIASVEVETKDWHAALSAVRRHAAGKDDVPLLQQVHVSIRPGQNVHLSATDRYTVGVAVVSLWEDHVQSGEIVEVDLAPGDVADLQIFKPVKGANPENRLRVDVTAQEVRVTEVAGMVETDADKSLTLPRQELTDAYPDVEKLVARCVRQAVQLRQRAEDEGSAGEAAVDEVFTNAALLARFSAAASAYGEPLVIQRTAEARTALLIACGESFVGALMPISPDDHQVERHRMWQEAWLRRLPEPDDEPLAMPRDPKDTRPADAAPDGPGPVYEPAPDDGTVEPGDRLRCVVDGCTWTVETSMEDADSTVGLARDHVGEAHGFRGAEWQQGMALIVAERLVGWSDEK